MTLTNPGQRVSYARAKVRATQYLQREIIGRGKYYPGVLGMAMKRIREILSDDDATHQEHLAAADRVVRLLPYVAPTADGADRNEQIDRAIASGVPITLSVYLQQRDQGAMPGITAQPVTGTLEQGTNVLPQSIRADYSISSAPEDTTPAQPDSSTL